MGSYESHGTHFLIFAPGEREVHLPESVSLFQHKTLVAVMSKFSATRLSSAQALCFFPPHSPDLNPIEKFWCWLKRELRRLDLRDLKSGRGVLGKTAYKARIRSVLRKKGTQKVASRFSAQLYSACQEVIKKKGAASRG